MNIIMQIREYLIVEMANKFEVLKKDFYYDNDMNKKTTYELCARTTTIERAVEIMNNRLNAPAYDKKIYADLFIA